MSRHWEENSSGGRLACRVVRTVGNALYLGAQGGILAGFGFAKSATFGTVSRAKGTVGKRRTPKITSEKQEWQRCGYRILRI
jgi:hypothetical protein